MNRFTIEASHSWTTFQWHIDKFLALFHQIIIIIIIIIIIEFSSGTKYK